MKQRICEPKEMPEMDVRSLYPKQFICYERMYEFERIKRTMKKGTKVTPNRRRPVLR